MTADGGLLLPRGRRLLDRDSIFIGRISFRCLRAARTARPLPDFQPFVSVIAPSRGLEPGWIDNLRPLLEQDYPRYEVLFVFDRADDPAMPGDELATDFHGFSRTIIAGPATDSGQKVHNLRVAVTQVDPKSEVLVFVDTDARPASDWLRKLVAPLMDETLGASSGYRWFVPVKGGIASRLRGVWNASIASALGADATKNFCWGGSTAIRRTTFERLERSTSAGAAPSLTISRSRAFSKPNFRFTSRPTVWSVGRRLRLPGVLLEFTTRQIKITRVYASHSLASSPPRLRNLRPRLLRRPYPVNPANPRNPVYLFICRCARSHVRAWRNEILHPLARRLQCQCTHGGRDLVAHVFLWPVRLLALSVQRHRRRLLAPHQLARHNL